MMPWIIAGAGVLVVILVLIIVTASHNKKSRAKLKQLVQETKVAPEPEKKPVPPPKQEDSLSFSQPEPKKPVVAKYNPMDFEFDDDELTPEEEARYDEFMKQRMQQPGRFRRIGAIPIVEKQPFDDDQDGDRDFEEFRNEHCYSKYVTDGDFAKYIKDLPPEIQAILFSSAFARIDTLDGDNKF